MKNNDVIETFVEFEGKVEGRTENLSIRRWNNMLYSYDLPICQICKNKIAYVNAIPSSVTTSTHRNAVMRCLDKNDYEIRFVKRSQYASESLEDTYKEDLKIIKSLEKLITHTTFTLND